MYPKIFDHAQSLSPLPKLKATRRGFILGAVATAAGLAVGFRLPSPATAQDAPAVHPF